MYLLIKQERIDGIIISPILGSLFLLLNLFYNNWQPFWVYIDKNGFDSARPKKVWNIFTNNIVEIHPTRSQQIEYQIFENILFLWQFEFQHNK